MFSLNTSIYIFLCGATHFLAGDGGAESGHIGVGAGHEQSKALYQRAANNLANAQHVGVVLLTAKLTGGIGLHAFGSDIGGGKKYLYVSLGILSYFALTARRIPPERANLYVALFLLGGVTPFIGDLYPITPPFLHFIFWLFPPVSGNLIGFQMGVTRLAGIRLRPVPSLIG